MKPFVQDLTPGDIFPWRAFLAGSEWGKAIYANEGVLSFSLVLLRRGQESGAPRQEPAFCVQTENGQTIVVDSTKHSYDDAKYVSWTA